MFVFASSVQRDAGPRGAEVHGVRFSEPEEGDASLHSQAEH